MMPARLQGRLWQADTREVAEGDTFTVTSHGRPIARIVPAEAKGSEAAKQRLLEHLRSQPAVEISPLNRGELYDR
jgi:prevent-host-death family protein